MLETVSSDPALRSGVFPVVLLHAVAQCPTLCIALLGQQLPVVAKVSHCPSLSGQ